MNLIRRENINFLKTKKKGRAQLLFSNHFCSIDLKNSYILDSKHFGLTDLKYVGLRDCLCLVYILKTCWVNKL